MNGTVKLVESIARKHFISGISWLGGWGEGVVGGQQVPWSEVGQYLSDNANTFSDFFSLNSRMSLKISQWLT